MRAMNRSAVRRHPDPERFLKVSYPDSPHSGTREPPDAMRRRWTALFTCALALGLPACVRDGGDAAREAGATPDSGRRRAGSAEEFREARERMVERQIVSPVDGRPPVESEAVLAAMRAVPRHAFVPEDLADLAYEDSALPIGAGQTISQPYIVALVAEKLALDGESKVLEVGSGSGYQAAVLAEITPHVYAIEILRGLYEESKRTLEEEGYTEVRLRHGDGYRGWPEASPFDGIIVSCAAEEIPEPLWIQLRPGGRIVIPIGDPRGFQELVVVHKNEDGTRRVERIADVRFVPLTGEGARR